MPRGQTQTFQRGFLCGEGKGLGRWLLQAPRQEAPSHPVLQAYMKGVLGEGEALLPPGESPARFRGGHGGGGEPGGKEEEGRGEGTGGGGRGRVIACLSVLLSALEGACVVVGVASRRGVCVCWQRCQCACLGGLGSPRPPPLLCVLGDRGSGHTQLCSVLMRQMWQGPQLCRLPREGEGAAICSPDNGC